MDNKNIKYFLNIFYVCNVFLLDGCVGAALYGLLWWPVRKEYAADNIGTVRRISQYVNSMIYI